MNIAVYKPVIAEELAYVLSSLTLKDQTHRPIVRLEQSGNNLLILPICTLCMSTAISY
jgi:hypothetical protein